MRTALCIAIGLAVPVNVVPASLAHGKPAGTGIEAKERQAHQGLRSNMGISIVEPIGRVLVGPESVGGEPVYVRRTTVREGVTIVEVSTTPFIPASLSKEEAAEVAISTVITDQPAGW